MATRNSNGDSAKSAVIQDIFAKMERMELEKHDMMVQMEKEKLDLALKFEKEILDLTLKNISLERTLFSLRLENKETTQNESEANIPSDGPEKTTALKISPTSKNNGDRFYIIDGEVYPPS
jgi:hypothetical protein